MLDVRPSALHEGARQLQGDSADLDAAGGKGVGGANDATAPSGEGPLAAALATFADELTARSAEMSDASGLVGQALADAAMTYETGDGSAAGSLRASMPE